MTGDVVAALVMDVAARPSEIRSARQAVASHLSARGVPSVVVDDFELVTSELVTNAIIHPASPQTVHVELCVGAFVELVVSNVGSAAAIPQPDEWHPAPAASASGRGLGIVRRLCDEVSVEQRGQRTAVVCRRRLPDGGLLP